MTYSKFQYCKNLRKEINRLERIMQNKAQRVRKDYDGQKQTEQTLKKAKTEFEKIKQEIIDWLATAPLSKEYKESAVNYYIKGRSIKVQNLEREIKRCLGEV